MKMRPLEHFFSNFPRSRTGGGTESLNRRKPLIVTATITLSVGTRTDHRTEKGEPTENRRTASTVSSAVPLDSGRIDQNRLSRENEWRLLNYEVFYFPDTRVAFSV